MLPGGGNGKTDQNCEVLIGGAMSDFLDGWDGCCAETDGLQELETHVQRKLNGRLADFRLVLHDGGLILHGNSCSYYIKQLAQEAIRGVTRLPILCNKIAVRQPSPHERWNTHSTIVG